MAQLDPRPSVPAQSASVKSKGRARTGSERVEDVSMLFLSILHDPSLRRSALSIAVLTALIAAGASADAFTPAPLNLVASELQTSYDTVYKRLLDLTRIGYVQISRATEAGRRRLFLRLVWPQTQPTKRTGKTAKRG